MKKIIDYRLKDKFIRNYCRVNDDGMLCPFVVEGKCINLTYQGVMTHRRLVNTEVTLNQRGCDYILIKIIILLKDFFIGHSIEYTDGSNMDDSKNIINFQYQRENNLLFILIKGQDDKIPYKIPFKTDYLSFEEKNDCIIINDDLGYGNSLKVIK